MEKQFKFMIHFKGAPYSNELYCIEKGSYIYDLDKAIETAEARYPDCEYEVYNGNQAYSNIKDN